MLIFGIFQIKRTTVEKYCGDGEPPSWKLIIQKPKSNNATLADCDGTVTLEGSAWEQERLIVPIKIYFSLKQIGTCK